MKELIKKWWFWVIIAIVCVLLIYLTIFFTEKKKTKDSLSVIGNSVSNYISDTNEVQSHIDEFSYNYETKEVEYKPSKVTMEMYDRIEEKMNQDDVISILGKYEDRLEEENTYILEWGNSYSPIYGGYWIQIVFDNSKKVIRKYQTGLK